MHVYACICMYCTYMHVCTYMNVCMYMHVYARICTYIHIWTYVRICMYMHVLISVDVFMCIYVQIRAIRTYVHCSSHTWNIRTVYVCTYVHVYMFDIRAYTKLVFVYVHIRTVTITDAQPRVDLVNMASFPRGPACRLAYLECRLAYLWGIVEVALPSRKHGMRGTRPRRSWILPT